MLGKFYNINSQTLASGDIMTLATSRTCGCGIKLEGNEIVIYTPGSYCPIRTLYVFNTLHSLYPPPIIRYFITAFSIFLLFCHEIHLFGHELYIYFLKNHLP